MTVTVIDRGDMGYGCSYANAGWISTSHALPLPMPGVLRESARWLIDPEIPLYIVHQAPSQLVALCLARILRLSYDKAAFGLRLPGTYESGLAQSCLLPEVRRWPEVWGNVDRLMNSVLVVDTEPTQSTGEAMEGRHAGRAVRAEESVRPVTPEKGTMPLFTSRILPSPRIHRIARSFG